jgi:hypothetical protein
MISLSPPTICNSAALIAAVELLTEAVNILVLQVFRKDDYAVKYAVEPLLDGAAGRSFGPAQAYLWAGRD